MKILSTHLYTNPMTVITVGEVAVIFLNDKMNILPIFSQKKKKSKTSVV